MDFDAIRRIADPIQRIRAVYDIFDEESRLQGQAASVEFLSSMELIGEKLPRKARILDLGAGTGRYSLALAAMGHQVHAVELVEKHARMMVDKRQPGMELVVQCADALTALDRLPDNSFDAVLCMGPLYHLHDDQERLQCLRACARVCKPEGFVYAAFINGDMVIITQTLLYDGGPYLTSGDFDPQRFDLVDFPFKFDTLEEAEALCAAAGLQMEVQMGSDGLNELHGVAVDAFTPEEFAVWLRFHLYCCRKRHFLGASNHWLFRMTKGA